MEDASFHMSLRRARRRTALSQLDIAFLLGNTDGMVSRHERRKRLPDLSTAFAYEAIFRLPAIALFPQDARSVEDEVRVRAIQLYGRIARRKQTRRTKQKLDALRHLVR